MSATGVWAPAARRVDLVRGGGRTPLRRGADGWWRLDGAVLEPGSDYAFALDGGEPLPDPRSPWQPHGVHGFSRALDHAAFRWNDGGWQAPPLASAVIYEIHVGTFTPQGTFDAVIERLGYLRELGVTHLELMPVAEFGGRRGWGYDGVDLYAPHHAYGGPEGLKRLVDACHARGLAVLLDVVYNHLGPDGNYLARFGPYFTDRYGTPWGAAVNLDGPGSDEVRRFLCDNALSWLRDYHVDGLRLDAVHAIFDRSAVHFLEQLAAEVEQLQAQLGRHLVLIAESDLNDPRLVRPRAVGGYGLDAQWSDDFHHALHAVLTGERSGYYADFGRMAEVAQAFGSGFVYDGRFSAHRGRRHGRPASGLSGRHLVVCLQNHDQVGNRARGERLAQLLGPERLKLAAALLLCAPGIPLLFQGEEWGCASPFLYFTDHQDPELGRAVSQGRRREFAAFGWDPEQVPDPQAPQSFERSRLDWSEREREPHAGLLAWHRALLDLRRRTPELSDGCMERLCTRFDEDTRWIRVDRGAVAIIANLGERLLRLPFERVPHRLLASSPRVRVCGDAVELPPDGAGIFRTDRA